MRSAVTQIASSGCWVVCLNADAICVAFNAAIDRSGAVVAYANGEGEEIQAMKIIDGRLFTVALRARDGYSALHCRAQALSELRRPLASRVACGLFAGEKLSSGFSFAEFNGAERSALTHAHSAVLHSPREFKVWRLIGTRARTAFALRDSGLADVKFGGAGDGVALCVYDLNSVMQTQRLGVADLASGKILRSLRCDVPDRFGAVVFLELVSARQIFIRQCGGPLRVLDTITGHERRVVAPGAHPTAFVSFRAQRITVTLSTGRGIALVWSGREGGATEERDALLGARTLHALARDAKTIALLAAPGQSALLALCRGVAAGAGSSAPPVSSARSRVTTIRVACLRTAQCVATFASRELAQATTLSWCAQRGVLAVGLSSGRVLVWS